MKGIIIVFGSVLIAIIFYFVVMRISAMKFPKLRKERQCEVTEDIIQKDIKGTLIRTFKNEESYYYEAIEYRINGDTIQSDLFELEQTGVYQKLVPGDSIVKEKGNLDFMIFRDKKKYEYKLSYGCNELLDKNVN